MLIVVDQDRSREFYRHICHILGAEVIRERDPVALRLGNGWLVLDVGGGPADDKPDVSTGPPESEGVLTSALDIRVADAHSVYRE